MATGGKRYKVTQGRHDISVEKPMQRLAWVNDVLMLTTAEGCCLTLPLFPLGITCEVLQAVQGQEGPRLQVP